MALQAGIKKQAIIACSYYLTETSLVANSHLLGLGKYVSQVVTLILLFGDGVW